MKRKLTLWLRAVPAGARANIQVTLGVLLMALTYRTFLIPNDIAPGGLTGFAQLLNELFGLPVGATAIVLNLPLFALGMRQMGLKFGVRSLVAMLAMSALIDALHVPPLTRDTFLASVYGGLLMGAGIGLVLRGGATTGGTDLAAKLIHHAHPIVSVSWVLFSVDLIVVACAGFVFHAQASLYALVTLFLSARVCDMVLEGINTAKAFYIISDASEAIARRIMGEMGRGVTALQGRGMYSGGDKQVLLCVISRLEMVQLKRIVRECDENAFVIVSEVVEALGEGFP